jgi:hypothetical protein
VWAPSNWLYLGAMSTFNPDERRSFDGFRRRPNLPPRRPPAERPAQPMAEPREAELVEAEAAVAPQLSPAVETQVAAPVAEAPKFEYTKRQQQRRPFRRSGMGPGTIIRRGALVLTAAVLLVGGWFGYKAFWAARTIISKSNGGAPALLGSVDPTKLKGEGDGRINVLLLGIGGQGHEAPNLSDTILVMSIDPEDEGRGDVVDTARLVREAAGGG